MKVSQYSKTSTANVVVAVPLVILKAMPETLGLAHFDSFNLHGINFEEQRLGGQGQ